MYESNVRVLATAADFDPALRGGADLHRRLAPKRIRPKHATREALFTAIAEGHPALLTDIPVPVVGARRRGLQAALLSLLQASFAPGELVRAQVGARYVRRRLAISELLRRWQSGRHLVSVTDLHVRGTRLERDIDTGQLSAFNLLPRGSEDVQRQEMMTLVVSSCGNVTDSHSDDPDGSNHCFVGRKLWLAWETFEGQKAGLQDCSRDLIVERAHFDLGVFASLKTARWWTVGPGETLFLPGRLSHRVITLEPYIGIGSFYFTPVSCLENLSRWYHHGALWSIDDPKGDNEGLVDEIAMTMARKLRLLARQSSSARQKWGLDFAPLAFDCWQRRWTRKQRQELLEKPHFASLVDALASPVNSKKESLPPAARALA